VEECPETMVAWEGTCVDEAGSSTTDYFVRNTEEVYEDCGPLGHECGSLVIAAEKAGERKVHIAPGTYTEEHGFTENKEVLKFIGLYRETVIVTAPEDSNYVVFSLTDSGTPQADISFFSLTFSINPMPVPFLCTYGDRGLLFEDVGFTGKFSFFFSC
jgi:hypothetical protein